MKCPKCESTLVAKLFREVEVDRCPKCHGIWFDKDELPDFFGLTRRELRHLQRGRLDEQLNHLEGECPRDGKPLLRVISPQNKQVVIDACATCSGVWLDDGELKKLNQSVSD